MKKTVPFELFGPNQFLMFDISRLDELEKSLGYSVNTLLLKGDGGVGFCLKALPIAMKQHYYKPEANFFAEMIENHLENGGKLFDIEVPLIKAIQLTGIFGKVEDQNKSEEVEKQEKNEEGQPSKRAKKATAAVQE
jgi:hypothetical protein